MYELTGPALCCAHKPHNNKTEENIPREVERVHQAVSVYVTKRGGS